METPDLKAAEADPKTSSPSDSKRNGGRPKKPKKERRDHVVPVRMNDAEYRLVEEKAEASGLSKSAYMRRAATGRPISPKADAMLRRELRRIGVDLNQLAASLEREPAHVGGPDAAAVRATTEELRRVLNELRDES
ncbi:MAG: ribbon-helix-helix protein, CopG family [Rhodothermales bacterium]